MQDKTINNALVAIYRAGGKQGNLAAQILALRDATPASKRHRCKTAFKRGQMRMAIMDVLRGGAMTSEDLAARIQPHKPDWTIGETTLRVRSTLDKMRVKGLVKREGQLWGLAP